MLYILIIFGFAAIYISILKNFEEPIIEKIQKSKDFDEVISERKKLIKIRTNSIAIYFLVFTVIAVIIGIFVEPFSAFYAWILAIIYSYRGIAGRKDHNPLGTMYYQTKKDALKYKYIFFLRGFEKDDYTPTASIPKYKSKFDNFSEYHFMKILSSYIKVFAVGMTKEIEAPAGAPRIYLDDATWQDDVNELMHSSVFNIILVNDRPSCLWEIERSADILRKTVFIVDDKIKYMNVVEYLEDSINFPEFSDNQVFPVAIFFDKENNSIEYNIQNTTKSYRRLINLIFKDYVNLSSINQYTIVKTRETTNSGRFLTIAGLFVGIIGVIIIAILIINFFL